MEPPVSDLPAAGICAEPSGDVVTIAVEPDTPSPRCSRVTSSQRLRVVNQTSEEIDVQIADFKMRLGAGDEGSVDAPFGSYLAPGVHLMNISSLAGGGAEIWLGEGR